MPSVTMCRPAGDAGLALVVETRPGADHGGLVQVGVVENDQRVVAAELQRHLLQQAARGLRDPPADRGGAGEVDHRDVRVGDQALAHLDVTRQHLEKPGGQPGLCEQLGDGETAGQRGFRGRLDQHRVAEGERRRDHPHAEHQREVPRRDDANQPDRHPFAQRQSPGVRRRHQLAGRAGGERRRLDELAGRRGDLVVGLAADAAGLAHDQLA
jgi:hypothetical protein